MHTTTLYLDLRSSGDAQHHAALVAEQGQVLAENSFEYRLDAITILTELEQLDPQHGHPALRLERIQAFGANLYHKVFSPEMHAALQQAVRDADGLRLIVRLDGETGGLGQVPWEFLHDDNGFLAADEKLRLFRYPQQAKPQPLKPLTDEKLRILCLVSSPLDLADHERLAVEWEQERLLQVLDLPLSQGQVEIEFEDEATLPNLEAALDEGHYHILHYTGHGAYNPRTGGSLVLENDQGNTQHVGWKELRFVLEKGLARGLRLVFLSGCQTAKCSATPTPSQADSGLTGKPTPTPSQEGKSSETPLLGGDGGGSLDGHAFSDLARPLIHAGFPAVIAMQYGISDAAGRLLAETFYRSIVRGEPVDAALSDARRQVLLHQNLVVQGDFATPVLFSANPDCLQRSHPSVETGRRPVSTALADIKIDPAYQVPLQQLGAGFVGRRKELRQIKQLFLQGNVRAIILHGIGGIGKTVTATQAARRLRKSFQGVYAFDCATGILSPDQLVTELHHFLQTIGVDVLKELVYTPIPPKQKATYLAQVLEQLPLLLIFDNMESLLDKDTQRVIADPDLAVFLRTLINAVTHGTKFLFTSRYTFHLLEDERHGDAAPMVGYRLQQAYFAINLGDLSRPEAIQVMHRFPSLSKAGFGVKEAIYAKLGGHPYTLNVFAHHCQTKTPEDVLRSLGEVTGETARFAMLERSWNALSDRTRNLLKRIAVFQKPVPLDAIEWVIGEEEELRIGNEELRMWREMIAKAENAPEELRNLSDKELYEMLKQMLPQQRRSDSVTNEIEELIHWGLIVQVMEMEGRDGSPTRLYNVHTLVCDFCRGKMEPTECRAALLDAAQFYQNLAKALPQESPEQAFTKLDIRHLLFEAEEFEQAGEIVIDVFPLLHRWGFL
jgi:CHAT domain-containing protein